MRSKILSKRAMLIAILSGFALFAVLLLSFALKNSTWGSSTLFIENVATLPNQEQANTELPVRLKIPAINVNAPFEYVGLTSDGAMDVPEGPNEVAWFNLGPRPGENGSAVIVGHYGWESNTPAVFDDLHKLRIGDKISVENENGTRSIFVVREMRTYHKDEAAPEVFGSSDGKAYLNLITCTGAWNKEEETFSERLVVFAEKE